LTAKGGAEGRKGAATPTQAEAADNQRKRRKLPRRRYPAEYLSRGSDLPQAAKATKPPLDRKTKHSHTYSPHPAANSHTSTIRER